MASYRGLEWKTGAARRLRPLRRDAAVFSWLFKAHSKFGSSKYTPSPLAEQPTRHQTQTVAWAQQREQVSHFSFAFLCQGFEETLWCCCKADPEQVPTQTSIRPVQLQQHWRFSLQPDQMTPQLQKTRHCAPRTISLMYRVPPSA